MVGIPPRSFVTSGHENRRSDALHTQRSRGHYPTRQLRTRSSGNCNVSHTDPENYSNDDDQARGRYANRKVVAQFVDSPVPHTKRGSQSVTEISTRRQPSRI